ncbi:MAG: site-specific DNA-methyltransferase [Acidimicrobiales bacterium]
MAERDGNGQKRRGRTSTSNFGVGRRESHDATAFYDRFGKVEVSDADDVARPEAVDTIWLGDAREMDRIGQIADNSVALVVTSPPYFAGKAYEEVLGTGHVPASYEEYLTMLRDVFSACKAKLEPGGRIAVNVANLGRKPFRSLSSDVIDILQRDLGLLLRGEIIWLKQRAAGGSCAWGTYQRPGNPVLRDLTERIIVASKGRFDRALPAARRAELELPSEGTMFMDDFVDATTDLWEIPPESATRVGHPAPFPVELPRRLIQLYTYRNDLVLDPFMGSGSTAIAAVQTDRHYIGFDTDPDYLARAEERITEAKARLTDAAEDRWWQGVTVPPTKVASPAPDEGDDDPKAFQRRSVEQGRKAKELARDALEWAGFGEIEEDVKLSDLGLEVNFVARDVNDDAWYFDVSGAFSSTRPGLKRTDTLWKALGKASVLHAAHPTTNYVLLSTDKPVPRSAGDRALSQVRGSDKPVRDVIGLKDDDDLARLRTLYRGRR